MRLSPDDIAAIKECARRRFGEAAVVRLFGSRARDDLRGGDIDLHVIAATWETASLRAELAFLADLEDRIGERRVDLLVLAPDDPLRAIDRIAVESGIVM